MKTKLAFFTHQNPFVHLIDLRQSYYFSDFDVSYSNRNQHVHLTIEQFNDVKKQIQKHIKLLNFQ